MRRRRNERTPSSVGLAAEPVQIALDNGTLRGWLVRAAAPARDAVVFAHGWRSNAGDLLAWAAPAVRAGYDALLYGAPGHGASDETEFTSLRHMRDDMRAAVRWLRARPDAAEHIALFGHSMGGAAAILAAADEPPAALVLAGAPTDPLDVGAGHNDVPAHPRYARALVAFLDETLGSGR